MLNVFYSIDVEVWCGSWDSLDRRFPEAFRSHIYGPTSNGNFGLDYQLRVLREHGLTAVCFLEPLFATRFGLGPLEEVVQLINEHRHEIQLHVHPEWASESRSDLLPRIPGKRRMLREFTLGEQVLMLKAGKLLLKQAGAGEISAFRAGNFGMNAETLLAVEAAGLTIDSSYNAALNRRSSGLLPETPITEPIQIGQVLEVPMTVFSDGMGGLGHAQLGACSALEMERLLGQALEAKRRAFVILSHSFELLNRARLRSDAVMVKRFHRLCEFLGRHSAELSVHGFTEARPIPPVRQPAPLTSSARLTIARRIEQLARVRFG